MSVGGRNNPSVAPFVVLETSIRGDHDGEVAEFACRVTGGGEDGVS